MNEIVIKVSEELIACNFKLGCGLEQYFPPNTGLCHLPTHASVTGASTFL
jgi:hypothetical protein